MKKILIFEKRKKARELRKKKWGIRKIASSLIAGKDNVGRWIKMSECEISEDKRGWKKGRLRVYSKEDEKRIIKIRKELREEESFFFGAAVVKRNYERKYGKEIKLWFVEKVLREAYLTKGRKEKVKGMSKYMHYPTYTLSKLGEIVMAMDFIGPRFLKGQREGINFLSLKYIRPRKYGLIRRIEGQTTSETIRILSEVWKHHPLPDVLKVDNDSAFGAQSLHKESVGRLTFFLLNLGVIPLYIAPRSPWNNGDVEGFNSIFSKKFWNRINFSGEEEIDVAIKKFNCEYEKYTDLVGNNPPPKEPRFITDFKDFKTKDWQNRRVKKLKAKKIYFLRIVRRRGERGKEGEKGFINILGREVILNKKYLNLFVLCKLDLEKIRLSINVEEDRKLVEIAQKKFAVKNVLNLYQG